MAFRGYAVIDFETTGLVPEHHHRVIELAVVHLDPSGAVEGAWETVVNPDRDLAVALRASLRTTAPLVGAGIDRIVHAAYVERLSPLQLVARARTALATVGSSGGPRCTELLG